MGSPVRRRWSRDSNPGGMLRSRWRSRRALRSILSAWARSSSASRRGVALMAVRRSAASRKAAATPMVVIVEGTTGSRHAVELGEAGGFVLRHQRVDDFGQARSFQYFGQAGQGQVDAEIGRASGGEGGGQGRLDLGGGG